MLSFVSNKRRNSFITFVLMIVTISLVVDLTHATFKKPPFNGSIFGKRGNGVAGKLNYVSSFDFIYNRYYINKYFRLWQRCKDVIFTLRSCSRGLFCLVSSDRSQKIIILSNVWIYTHPFPVVCFFKFKKNVIYCILE